MGTQFQRLTTPRALGPESVQADSAWNLEAHHVIFPGPAAAAREDSGGLLDQGPNELCGLGSQREILSGSLPCALKSALRGNHCPGVFSATGSSWYLTQTLTLPRSRSLHRNLSLPRTLTLYMSCLAARASLQPSKEITRPQSRQPWRRPWTET